MTFVLATLALLSLALTLWQWLAARRFPLHRRAADRSFAPDVTLLKPLKGCDADTKECLRSWFAQEYPGRAQILFGVASPDDPACAVVRELLQEFPDSGAQLVVCPESLGANAKVSKLIQLERLAQNEIIIISDADVRVPGDFLINAVAPLREDDPASCGREREFAADSAVFSRTQPQGRIGLVNCFYHLANPATTAMRWEAVAVNADFWSQVLQAKSLGPLDFALGAVMATRRKQLAEIGGFAAIVNCLADDYQLGHRIAKFGHRIEICPIVVECWSPPMGWADVWRHQLRWARTIRVCKPVSYFFSILGNATLWPLLWLVLRPSYGAGMTLFFCLVARIFTALHLQWKLTRSAAGDRNWRLVPVKDLLQAAIWLLAFTGNRIEWRGQYYCLHRDGTLENKR